MNSVPLVDLAHAAAALIAGLAVGGCHFASLRLNARLFGAGHAARAGGLQLARIVLTSVALFALARFGALALIAGMAGFLLARGVALRSAGTVREGRP